VKCIYETQNPKTHIQEYNNKWLFHMASKKIAYFESNKYVTTYVIHERLWVEMNKSCLYCLVTFGPHPPSEVLPFFRHRIKFVFKPWIQTLNFLCSSLISHSLVFCPVSDISTHISPSLWNTSKIYISWNIKRFLTE
jgi:hypothetical protein